MTETGGGSARQTAGNGGRGNPYREIFRVSGRPGVLRGGRPSARIADVHVRPRHRPADRLGHRPVRAGRDGGRGRLGRLRGLRTAGWPGWRTGSASAGCCRPLAAFFALSTAVVHRLRRAARAAVDAAGHRHRGRGVDAVGRAPWSGPGGAPCWATHRRLHTAFALESVNDEMIFVIGPACRHAAGHRGLPGRRGRGSGRCCAWPGRCCWPPSAAPSRPRSPRATASRSRAAQRPARPAAAPTCRAPAGPRAGPGLAMLAPVYWLIGAMFAAIDLSTVAFAAEHGHKPLAGLILGSLRAGQRGRRAVATARAPGGRRVARRFAITLCTRRWPACPPSGPLPGLLPLTAVVFCLRPDHLARRFIAGYSLVERRRRRSGGPRAWPG